MGSGNSKGCSSSRYLLRTAVYDLRWLLLLLLWLRVVNIIAIICAATSVTHLFVMLVLLACLRIPPLCFHDQEHLAQLSWLCYRDSR